VIEEALRLLEFDRVKEIFKKYTFSENGKRYLDSVMPTTDPWQELDLLDEMIELVQREDLPLFFDFNIS
jgi:DNA mismatch repair protein MutS2